MADEELVSAEELEPTGAPVEGEAEQEPDPNVNDAEPGPIEALASEMGWAPKDQFRGSPDDWKPADEFIRAGREIQRNLSRELKDVKGAVENISRTSASILAERIAERDAYWQSKRNEAIDAGDREAVEFADQQRENLRQTMPAPQTGPSQEGLSFVEKHATWFGKDTEATEYATNRCLHYAKEGLSQARQLAAVERDMKDLFPDLFPAQRPAPSVARPGSRTVTQTSRKKGFHDLTREEQLIAKDMADRGVIPNVEAYVTHRFKNEGKVG